MYYRTFRCVLLFNVPWRQARWACAVEAQKGDAMHGHQRRCLGVTYTTATCLITSAVHGESGNEDANNRRLRLTPYSERREWIELAYKLQQEMLFYYIFCKILFIYSASLLYTYRVCIVVLLVSIAWNNPVVRKQGRQVIGANRYIGMQSF